MSRWYRAYEGTCTDPKLAEAALVAGCSRSVAIAAWHLTLENAATVNDGGRIDIPTRRIAAALCEPFDTIEMLFSSFESIGLIADSRVTAWKRRQYESDSSTERSRKHRANKKKGQCNGDATLQDRCATPPETETEVSVAEATGADAPTAADLTKAVWDSGKTILKAAGHNDRSAGSIIGRFRKTYSDSQVLIALSRCQVEQPSDPVGWLTKTLQAEQSKSAGSAANGRQFASNDEIQNPYARVAARRQADRVSAEWG